MATIGSSNTATTVSPPAAMLRRGRTWMPKTNSDDGEWWMKFAPLTEFAGAGVTNFKEG